MAGFSLFELTVFIIVAAIIYSVAVNRFTGYPAAAERANFMAVLTQLQSGVNLEVMLGLSSGQVRNLREYHHTNPMDFLLQPPANYLGAFASVDASNLERRHWVFDNSRGELIYLVENSDTVVLRENGQSYPGDELRFRLEVMYRDRNSQNSYTLDELQNVQADRRDQGQETAARPVDARVSGALLQPVVAYEWGEVEIDVDAALEVGQTP